MNARFKRKEKSSVYLRLGKILLFLAIILSSLSLPASHAAGEAYMLSLSSNRVQESNTPGVTLYLQVANAMVGSTYQFTFTVTGPAGPSHNAANSTTATSSSLLLSVVFPRDFGAVLVQYVGNYTINVRQTQPTVIPTVATGRFSVGLTDSKTYQRTRLVSIKATGYTASENITTSLVHAGMPVQGFPGWQLADAAGNLNFSWWILPNAPTGTSTLSLAGSRTTKVLLDTQSLTVNATYVTILGLTANTPAISRSLTQQLLFAGQYPDGTRVQTGQARVRIAESDGVTSLNTTGKYDSSTGNFRAPFTVAKDAIVGIWIATIDANNFDDGYGNTGPALGVSAGFSVQTATLNVTILSGIPGKTFNEGDIIPVYAAVGYPDGTVFTTGTVTAKFSHAGVLVGTPVTLYYIPGQKEWAGNYVVTNADPSGIWLITVDASDQYTDTGEGTSSAAVSVPPTSQQSTGIGTSLFLLVTAIAAAITVPLLLLAILVRRKKVTRSEVKLDLRIVDKEFDRIQNTDFFRNVKNQVDKDEPDRTAKSADQTADRKDSQRS